MLWSNLSGVLQSVEAFRALAASPEMRNDGPSSSSSERGWPQMRWRCECDREMGSSRFFSPLLLANDLRNWSPPWSRISSLRGAVFAFVANRLITNFGVKHLSCRHTQAGALLFRTWARRSLSDRCSRPDPISCRRGKYILFYHHLDTTADHNRSGPVY